MSTYFPLIPYYSRRAYQILKQSKNSFFSALTYFNVDFAYNYITKSTPNVIIRDGVISERKLGEYICLKVPAYKRLLKENRVDKPVIDKENYLLENDFTDMLPNGDIGYADVISVSSGSSGKPFFWPRGKYLELETTIIHEILLKYVFDIDKKHTLFINAYSMGMYVAGVFTNNAVTRIAERGYNISIINPGISEKDIIRIIKEIGRAYDQIIISGYPPFILDVIEAGRNEGIKWKEKDLKFIFGAEAISEEWRNNLLKLIGDTNKYFSSFNTYGSADLAMLGHETPFSIFIKDQLVKNKHLYKTILNSRSISTLVQYHPSLKHFNEKNGELFCSGLGGIPLYNYNLHDHGSVYTIEDMIGLFESVGVNIIKLAEKENIPIWNLPFVVLFGKSDQTVTLYGLNVYPQTIRKALESKELIDFVTARSTISTEYKKRGTQYLKVIVELKKGERVSNSKRNKISEKVFQILFEDNYEYRTLYQKIGDKAKPVIKLVMYGRIAENRGIKQQWIKR